MSKTLQVSGGAINAIIPRNLEDIATVSSAFIKSGLVPDSYGKERGQKLPPDEVKSRLMVGIMKSLEVGLPPITGINTIAIINGRPAIWGDGAMALIHGSGQLTSIEDEYVGPEPEGDIRQWDDDFGCMVTMRREGIEGAVSHTFTVGDARRAGLWGNTKKDPWIKYPKRMLYNRARAWCQRDLFSDVLSGLSIVEEVQDQPMKDVTPVDTSFLDDEPKEIEHADSKSEAEAEQQAHGEEAEKTAPEAGSEGPPSIKWFEDLIDICPTEEALDNLLADDEQQPAMTEEQLAGIMERIANRREALRNADTEVADGSGPTVSGSPEDA